MMGKSSKSDQQQARAAAQRRLAENRRARFNYEILETYTAGLVLQGWEVKSVRGDVTTLPAPAR